MKSLSEIQESVWVEKHRPKNLDDLVLPEDHRKIFTRCIQKQEMNNFLFHGSPGGGKSALARIICSKNGLINFPQDNVLFINGSAKRSRSINFVEEVIEPFLKIPPLKDKFKVVFIDEGDNLTPDAFKSLRAIMEKFLQSYGRFILTCNYVSKLPDPLRSRFDEFYFKQLPKDYVLTSCKKILDKELIQYKEEDISFIINSFYPDIRRIVNRLERCSQEGKKLIVDKDRVLSIEKKIIGYFLQLIDALVNNENHNINKNVDLIITEVSNPEISYEDIYTELFFNEKIPSNIKIIVNKYSNGHQNCLVPSMHFVAMIFEINSVMKQYMILAGKK